MAFVSDITESMIRKEVTMMYYYAHLGSINRLYDILDVQMGYDLVNDCERCKIKLYDAEADFFYDRKDLKKTLDWFSRTYLDKTVLGMKDHFSEDY